MRSRIAIPLALAALSVVAAVSVTSCVAHTPASVPAAGPGLDVQIQTDEADAALAVLAAHRAGRSASGEAWDRLFASEGYRRLRQREHALGRAFEDVTVQAFLAEDSVVAQAPALAAAVADWQRADLRGAARRALAYLPVGTRLRATVYPVIKPQPNSFVFDVEADPAIFLYVDPEVPRAKLENTVAHELHHIGYAAACEGPGDGGERVRTAVTWAGAFGEGLAMLAAAGGPDVHPHAVSGAEERARWDRDVANVEADLRRAEAFFLDVLDERLADPDSVRGAAMSFFGVQGPWYTVGWTMAATVERAYGRDRLVDVLCDPRRLMATHNAAAEAENALGARLPTWSPSLLRRLGT